MAIQALDRAVEVTKAKLSAEGGLLATVALAVIGVPAMAGQVVLATVPMAERVVFEQKLDWPEPTVPQTIAFAALMLAQMVGQLTVARLLAVDGETVREALRVAGRRFLPFLAASLLVAVASTLVLGAAIALLGLLSVIPVAGVLLAVLLGLALLVLIVILFARLQLLVPQAVTSGEGPVALLRSVVRRSRGLTGSLVVLLIVVLLLSTIVPGAAKVIVGVPTAFAGGQQAGVIAGAVAVGLVSSLVTLLALSLAVAVHSYSGSGRDERDVRGG